MGPLSTSALLARRNLRDPRLPKALELAKGVAIFFCMAHVETPPFSFDNCRRTRHAAIRPILRMFPRNRTFNNENTAEGGPTIRSWIPATQLVPVRRSKFHQRRSDNTIPSRRLGTRLSGASPSRTRRARIQELGTSESLPDPEPAVPSPAPTMLAPFESRWRFSCSSLPHKWASLFRAG